MGSILLIEDVPTELKAYSGYLKSFFKDAGQDETIDVSGSFEDAKYKIGIGKYKLVIVDNDLGDGKKGVDLIPFIKNSDALTSIIVMTGYNIKREDVLKLGIFDCIMKDQSFVIELPAKVEYALKVYEYSRVLEFEKLKKYIDPFVLKKNQESNWIIPVENRTVTIVFWDIRGFTNLTAHLSADPQLVKDFLQLYFEKAREIINKNRGVLDKFIGDGIMAIFNAFDFPETQSPSSGAEEAIKCADELRNAFPDIYKNWIESSVAPVENPANLPSIGIGCGIVTGGVTIGNLGTQNRDHFTAIGRRVNLAARIESKTTENDVHMFVTTYNSCNDDKLKSRLKFYKKYKPYELKGVGEDTDVYKLV